MTSRGWRLYGIAVVLVMAGYQVTPDGAWWQTFLQTVVGYGTAVVMVIGAHRLPRADRVPWWLFALGLTGNSSGVPVMNHVDADLADAFYLSFYPSVALGLILLIRRRRGRSRRAALVDAATIAAGLGLVAWVYAIEPALADPAFTPLEHLVRASYPAGDLALVALTVLLIRNGVRQQPTPRWIALSQMMFLAGDLTWLVTGTLGIDVAGPVAHSVDAIYTASFAVFGYAVRRAGDPVPEDLGEVSARSGVPLMISLAAALLIAPAVLLAELATTGAVRHGLAVAVGSAIMSLLVVTRMFQLLRHSEHQAQVVSELSRRDELTGLWNRRAWTAELPRVLADARLRDEQVSVGMIDLDRFKLYNDRYGHPAGDRLLKAAAAAWSSALRRSDTLARYGGEEFIVLLPGADQEQATMVLERVRAATPDGQTFSAGVACWTGTEAAEDLIARADTALYTAKRTGRDRIAVASDPGLAMTPEILGP